MLQRSHEVLIPGFVGSIVYKVCPTHQHWMTPTGGLADVVMTCWEYSSYCLIKFITEKWKNAFQIVSVAEPSQGLVSKRFVWILRYLILLYNMTVAYIIIPSWRSVKENLSQFLIYVAFYERKRGVALVFPYLDSRLMYDSCFITFLCTLASAYMYQYWTT